MKRVTLEHLAVELGISKYSVSRALSGKPGVSESTRERVVQVARELGYRHRAVLRPRRMASQQTIVLLIPHHDADDVAYWMGLIAGASREAEEFGYTFVTRPLESASEHRLASLDRVAGVIVAGSRARPAMQQYLDVGIPAVLATYPAPLEPLDAVHNADHEGGLTVARHLMGLGHQRLAFVSEALDKPSFTARACGFREAGEAGRASMLEIGIEPDRPGASFERAYRDLAERGDGPTGLFASTDEVAFAVAWALGRLGLNVPGDVSVVGFNDAFGSARFVPPLTTLRAPTKELGAVAMRFLHERLEGRVDAPRRFQLAPALVIRQSTARPRSDVVALQRGHVAA